MVNNGNLTSSKCNIAATPIRLVSAAQLSLVLEFDLQMLPRFTWNANTIDQSSAVVKFRPIVFIPAFDGPPALGDPAIRSGYPLHGLWGERKKVVSSMVAVLYSSICDRCKRLEMSADLARMD